MLDATYGCYRNYDGTGICILGIKNLSNVCIASHLNIVRRKRGEIVSPRFLF